METTLNSLIWLEDQTEKDGKVSKYNLDVNKLHQSSFKNGCHV